MANKNEKQIPATYWQTGNGATLCNLMHGDGQEALDMLLSVEDGLTATIENETNEAIKAELEKAQKHIQTSLRAFRRGFYGLSNEGF